MLNLTTKLTNTIKDISQETWNQFFGNNILRQYNYYKTTEESNSNNIKLYYLQIYQNSELSAIAPIFIMDFPLGFSLGDRFKKITDFINKHLYHLVNIKTILVGAPSSYYCEIGISPNIDNPELIHSKLISEMFKLAKKEKALMLTFKDYPRKYKNILEKNGFCEIMAYPNVKLDINFNSFEEYLKTLSPQTRYDFRRKLKAYSNLPPISLEVKNNCSDCIDEIYALYMSTVKKNDLHFEIAPKEYFINICKNMPDETKIFLWKLNNKIVAFNLCLADKDNFIGDHIGLNYDIAFKYGLYFIAFKDKIEWCIKNNIKTFDEGTFTFEPKKRLKFNFYKNYFYMRQRYTIFNPLFYVMLSLFKPERLDPELKFLKKFNKI